jgi:ABC-2 type transport system ATP-binding protein
VGEVFGFLGPNGAGKTTTVHILTTLIRASGGRASVLGEDVERNPLAVRRVIGIVPEVSNIYEEYSAWDNLIFTARLYGLGRVVREERAQELLTRFDLWDRRASRTAGFSKGMKRRLCIAMGLMHGPRVLFLDEPTSGLDVQSSIAIRDTITRLKAGGTTVFLTTHNMDEAARVCDHVAVIHRGRLAAVDTPQNLGAAASSLITVEVFFERDGDWATGLAGLPSVTEVVREGKRWKLRTAAPSQLISAVVDWSRAQGLTISALNTVSPTLEEVFVQLTSAQRSEESDW